MSEQLGWRIARLLRRYPRLGLWIQRIYRLFQPRVSMGVVGVLLDAQNEHVLLVEHVFHGYRPWGLPGGWMGRNEDPAQTVEREFAEETGLRVCALYPLIVQRARSMGAHMDVVYRCVLNGETQTIRLSQELLNYRWTPLDDLPPMVSLHVVGIQAARETLQRQG